MKIALIGYGAMGKLIEHLAVEKGHEIATVIDEADAKRTPAEIATKLDACDVAIDFTTALAVRRNVEACLASHIPLVEGTTGWNEDIDTIRGMVTQANGAMVYGANFSIGVNLFYRIAGFAAELFAKFNEYETFIEEQHHSRKLDAPSGTALKIEEIISSKLFGEDADAGVRVPIAATRAGSIPGTHRVGFDGPADQVLLEHTARSRDGFAFGAIMAAEWIVGKKGFHEFPEIIREIAL
ncbi:MAG: 4-hydroxy-tetrahydrodipicolinate reductase [Pyrinomonadaceae bacterium]